MKTITAGQRQTGTHCLKKKSWAGISIGKQSGCSWGGGLFCPLMQQVISDLSLPVQKQQY